MFALDLCGMFALIVAIALIGAIGGQTFLLSAREGIRGAIAGVVGAGASYSTVGPFVTAEVCEQVRDEVTGHAGFVSRCWRGR